MIELEVSNFQAIRHATMAVNGFAAIVGRSNIGKSALVRAAYCALTGAVGTNFVRHGPECDRRARGVKKCKCFSKVVIRTQKMAVTWEKGDAVNKYTVERPGATAEVFDGLERGTPPFLVPDFTLVQVGERKELIQVPSQFEPIFLLNQSGMAVADVLSDVARLDQINTAMSMANKDRKDAVSKRKVREEDVEKLKTSIVKYDGLDDVPVQELLDARKDLVKKQADLEEVSGFITRLGTLLESLVALDTALKPEVPNHDTLESTSGKLYQVAGFLDEIASRAPLIRQLSGVEQIELPGTEEESLESAQDLYVKAVAFLERWETVSASAERYAFVDDVAVPDDPQLKGTCEQIDRIEAFSQKLVAVTTSIQGLEEVDVPDLDVEPVVERLAELGKVVSILARATAAVEAATKASKDLKLTEAEEQEVLQTMQGLGMCPVCDQAIGKDHALHLGGL